MIFVLRRSSSPLRTRFPPKSCHYKYKIKRRTVFSNYDLAKHIKWKGKVTVGTFINDSATAHRKILPSMLDRICQR